MDNALHILQWLLSPFPCQSQEGIFLDSLLGSGGLLGDEIHSPRNFQARPYSTFSILSNLSFKCLYHLLALMVSALGKQIWIMTLNLILFPDFWVEITCQTQLWSIQEK